MFKYPAKVLAEGKNFGIKLTKGPLPDLPPEITTKVEQEWERILTYDVTIPNTPLLLTTNDDGNLTIEGNTLVLACGPSDRKHLRGTTHESVASIKGGEYIRRGVSMLSVTQTADNLAFMGVRKPAITYPLQRHHVAGRLEVDEGDPITGIYAEYLQEAGIHRNEVEIECIGIAADMVVKNFEFIFKGTTKLTGAELIARALRAKSADEHIMFELFPYNAEYIRRNVLEPEPDGFPPTGFAGLAMALRHDFGPEAFPLWEPEATTYSAFMGRRGVMLKIK